jgi:membrane associated rhomboid family serine protease
MIPFRDDNPTRHFPFMTVALMAVNIALFAYMTALNADSHATYNRFVQMWAFTPASVLQHPAAPLTWITVFSAMFMHGGFLHIGGNMLYLWVFGNNIEDIMGPFRFLAFYLLCGIVATVTHLGACVLWDHQSVVVPSLGASGAIAGVLGAYLIRFPKAQVETCILFIFITVIRLPAIIVLGGWFLLQLFSGVGSLGGNGVSGGDGVAYWAHIGGFVAGMLLVMLFAARSRTEYDG